MDSTHFVINYNNSSIFFDSIDKLKSNKTVTDLSTHWVNINSEKFRAITKLLQHNIIINTIYLHYCTITESDIEYFCKMLKNNTTLRSITLNGDSISRSSAESIINAISKNSVINTFSVKITDIYNLGVNLVNLDIRNL